jgi:hypothetical protein
LRGSKGPKPSSTDFSKYPTADELEDSMFRALEKPLSDTDAAVVFGTGKGPGTYRDLLSKLKSSQDTAGDAAKQAVTAETFLKMFENDYPNLSDAEKKTVRGAARKFLLGMKKGFGGGVK